MIKLHAYRFTVGVYFLLLGVWIGAIVMSAVAAATIFKTVEQYQPSLHVAPYDAPEFADRADAILAGGVAATVFQRLAVVEVICSVGVMLCLIAQFVAFRDRMAPPRGWANATRVLLILIPIIVLAMDQLWLVPRMEEHLRASYDLALPAEQREQEREQFDALHATNVRTTGVVVIMLSAALLTSAWALLPGTARRAAARDAAA